MSSRPQRKIMRIKPQTLKAMTMLSQKGIMALGLAGDDDYKVDVNRRVEQLWCEKWRIGAGAKMGFE
jgi:hypothetical protein